MITQELKLKKLLEVKEHLRKKYSIKMIIEKYDIHNMIGKNGLCVWFENITLVASSNVSVMIRGKVAQVRN